LAAGEDVAFKDAPGANGTGDEQWEQGGFCGDVISSRKCVRRCVSLERGMCQLEFLTTA
jgi:hypothetical protein